MEVCSINSRCSNPTIVETDGEKFCFNCYQSFKKSEEKPVKINIYNCCENPNIIFGDENNICMSCGTIHQKIINETPYIEDDQYQTNVIYTAKKVHIPYKYLKKTYPEIEYERVYDFILNAIQIIQDEYKLKRKPFSKYVPILYNFYREHDPSLKVIEKFKNNNIILEKEIIDKIYKLLYLDSNTNSNYIKTNEKDNKPDDDEKILKKYYYFNKTKNKYFKRNKYCKFYKCFKLGTYKNEKNSKNYCKDHLDDKKNKININNKSVIKNCKYDNCKKNTIDEYCSKHRFICEDNECDIRIMKNNSYCKFHR